MKLIGDFVGVGVEDEGVVEVVGLYRESGDGVECGLD